MAQGSEWLPCPWCYGGVSDHQSPQSPDQPATATDHHDDGPSPQVGQVTEDQWRERLTPEEFHVLRQAGTERPYTGEYWDTHTEGVYSCRACGTELFRSQQKFDSHCGWPSFFAPLAEDRVEYIRDMSMGMERIEVRCRSCGSHMGHVFQGEGYDTPTDLRYCINSISLTLQPADPAAGA